MRIEDVTYRRTAWGAVVIGFCGYICLRSIAAQACIPTETYAYDRAASFGQAIALPLSEANLGQLGSIVASLLAGQPAAESGLKIMAAEGVAAYVALRQGGRKLAEGCALSATALQSLEVALAAARAAGGGGHDADVVELVLADAFEQVSVDSFGTYLSRMTRGLWGVEIRYGNIVELYAPTKMIADNTSIQEVVAGFMERHGIDAASFIRSATLRRLKARQFLVTLGADIKTVELYRGNRLVGIDQVTQANVAALAARMGDWMFRNVGPTGRLTYKYWPSTASESDRNNMIRQWMGSRCLIRIARHESDNERMAVAARNIMHNLEAFFGESDGLGVIEYAGKVKLGAVGLAALSLAEHPERERFAGYEAALLATVHHLRQADGSFRTFLKPPDRNDAQNYYPGEALLYLATVYRGTKDAALLDGLMISFRYYRSWHLANRNPAFVPWHTLAYFLIWEETKDPALSDWIFEMNDWLLTMQQKHRSAHPDVEGRFHDPLRQNFGPPHASATGVYLEGLARAFQLARELGDAARAEAYRTAIVWGIRSIMQLEFADDVDMYYVVERDRTRGGIRTTVNNNEIRVDNVQHALMAILDVLDTFEAKDFRP